MLPIGTLFRDLLFFQGYVGDPELLRSLGEDRGEAPLPPAATPVPARPGVAPGAAGLAAGSG